MVLARHRIEKLPIVDDDFRLVGLITVKDIQKRIQFPNASKDERGRLLVAAAVGTGPDTMERAAALVERDVDAIVVDTAHGHSRDVIETVAKIKANHPAEVVAGNVATADAARGPRRRRRRCDQGPGSARAPSARPGWWPAWGVPQISAVFDCASEAAAAGVPVIADGGMQFSGDLAKAIAAGAHSAMVGSLLAGTDESPRRGGAVPGRAFQGVSRHGLGGRHEGPQLLQGSILPGRSRGGRAGARGHRGARRLQGARWPVCCTSSSAGCARRWATAAPPASTTCGCAPGSCVSPQRPLRESHPHDIMITKEAPNYRAPT